MAAGKLRSAQEATEGENSELRVRDFYYCFYFWFFCAFAQKIFISLKKRYTHTRVLTHAWLASLLLASLLLASALLASALRASALRASALHLFARKSYVFGGFSLPKKPRLLEGFFVSRQLRSNSFALTMSLSCARGSENRLFLRILTSFHLQAPKG